MNVLATVERVLVADSDGNTLFASINYVETPYPPNAGPGDSAGANVALPAQPALWKQAIVDAIFEEAAARGNTVLRVVFQDMTSERP